MQASLNTPSKINLFLKVLGKRTDGYHNLDTIFLPLKDLCDIITLNAKNGNEILISCSNSEIPCDARNLCYKAAKLYMEKASLKASLKISIEKNIPITAGMGGGSSDAAATLLLLQKLFSALKPEELSEIALKVGADVPFFLNPKPSAGGGIGEILAPVNVILDFTVVICAPLFPVSAAWAYKNIVTPGICENLCIETLIKYINDGNYVQILPFIKNDLAVSLYNKFPFLESIKSDLISFGLDASEITGSGPTLFGITKDKKTASKTILKMKNKYGPSVYLTQSSILKTPYEIKYA